MHLNRKDNAVFTHKLNWVPDIVQIDTPNGTFKYTMTSESLEHHVSVSQVGDSIDSINPEWFEGSGQRAGSIPPSYGENGNLLWTVFEIYFCDP